MAVIEIEGLRKEYRRFRGGRTLAVDGLDMSVPEGGVYGFLGPNGSGKTTTIRCLLGLVRPTGGSYSVLGASTRRDLPKVMRRIGSLVESPAFFPNFSARRNLRLLGATYGIGKSRVNEILDQVGLAERAKDNVKTYSLGMKQRLGIGAALLKDPELLILDEPANGLDPAGIKEIRDLLRRLGEEGRTVFVSSHILSEVEQICDEVAILAHGRCVSAGPMKDLLSEHATSVLARVDAPDRALEVLRDAGIHATAGKKYLNVHVNPADAARVTRVLASKRIYLTELRPAEVDLETIFLRLTGDLPAAPTELPPEDKIEDVASAGEIEEALAMIEPSIEDVPPAPSRPRKPRASSASGTAKATRPRKPRAPRIIPPLAAELEPDIEFEPEPESEDDLAAPPARREEEAMTPHAEDPAVYREPPLDDAPRSES